MSPRVIARPLTNQDTQPEYVDSKSQDIRIETDIHESVNHPRHYNTHPSGVECIDIVEHMSFNLGNAVKYIWRADEKGNVIEDLEKAKWYIAREIERRLKASKDRELELEY